MRQPFLLAQVALKAYAAAFIVLILIPPPLIIPFTLFNIMVSAIAISIVVALHKVSKGLSSHKTWAQVVAYIVFIGFAGMTFPFFMDSITATNYSGYFWIQLWLLAMSALGVVSLLFNQIFKGKTEHLPPGDLAEFGP